MTVCCIMRCHRSLLSISYWRCSLGVCPARKKGNLRVFISTPFETWPEKITNQFDPSFFFFFLIKPIGYGSSFLLGLQADFSGESGQEGIPGFQRKERSKPELKNLFLSVLSLFPSTAGQSVSKLIVLWSRMGPGLGGASQLGMGDFCHPKPSWVPWDA